jgi:hypothetical protein
VLPNLGQGCCALSIGIFARHPTGASGHWKVSWSTNRVRSHEHCEAARGALEALEYELQLIEGEDPFERHARAREVGLRRDPHLAARHLYHVEVGVP